ncbi:hypothetical protein BaRGS_00039050, partial [Batillaria attramentaria]
ALAPVNHTPCVECTFYIGKDIHRCSLCDPRREVTGQTGNSSTQLYKLNGLLASSVHYSKHSDRVSSASSVGAVD